ncbi:hypothetical protein [Kitasatospora herbaricolor]|uniref:Uncharacterized protein n=1 Tax=Kitasatospora herbaricolor TaxID=68217 RepID=A0ABZ1WKX3_9ACTN|nr:hypothetical protein [Kitasatospora herbaricolor]
MAEVPEQLRLALAEERTSTSPLARGLDAPTDTWSVSGSDLVVGGWDADPGLFAVRPWLSQDPQHAVSLLQAALDTRVT